MLRGSVTALFLLQWCLWSPVAAKVKTYNHYHFPKSTRDAVADCTTRAAVCHNIPAYDFCKTPAKDLILGTMSSLVTTQGPPDKFDGVLLHSKSYNNQCQDIKKLEKCFDNRVWQDSSVVPFRTPQDTMDIPGMKTLPDDVWTLCADAMIQKRAVADIGQGALSLYKKVAKYVKTKAPPKPVMREPNAILIGGKLYKKKDKRKADKSKLLPGWDGTLSHRAVGFRLADGQTSDEQLIEWFQLEPMTTDRLTQAGLKRAQLQPKSKAGAGEGATNANV